MKNFLPYNNQTVAVPMSVKTPGPRAKKVCSAMASCLMDAWKASAVKDRARVSWLINSLLTDARDVVPAEDTDHDATYRALYAAKRCIWGRHYSIQTYLWLIAALYHTIQTRPATVYKFDAGLAPVSVSTPFVKRTEAPEFDADFYGTANENETDLEEAYQ